MMIEVDGVVVIPNFIEPDTMAVYSEEIDKLERRLTEGDHHRYDAHLNMGDSPILEEAAKITFDKIKCFIEDYYSCTVGAEHFSTIVVAKPGYALSLHADTYSDSVFDVTTHNGFASRDIATIIYFSDCGTDFTGGTLSYKNQNLVISPAKGTLVAAPCSENYLHEVATVESGERLYAVTFWHVLEKFDSTRYV